MAWAGPVAPNAGTQKGSTTAGFLQGTDGLRRTRFRTLGCGVLDLFWISCFELRLRLHRATRFYSFPPAGALRMALVSQLKQVLAYGSW